MLEQSLLVIFISNKPANSRMFENVLESSRHLAVILDVGVLERTKRFDNVLECSRLFKNFQGLTMFKKVRECPRHLG